MTDANTRTHRPFGWSPIQQFVLAVAMCASLGVGWVAFDTSVDVHWTLPLTLAGLFAAAEVFVVHLEYRRNAHTFSLVELPLVIGLVAAPPAVLISAHAIGAAAALIFHRRQRPIKLAFNLAAFALQDVLAIVVFRAFGSTAVGDTRTWFAVVVACLAASMLAMVLVQTVMWMSGDHPSRRDSALAARLATTFTCITAAAAVAAVLLWHHDRIVTIVIVPVMVCIFLAQRIQVMSIVRRDHLAVIEASLADVAEARSSDQLVDDLLARARETFGAREVSFIRIIDGEAHVRSCRHDAETFTVVEPASTWEWLAAHEVNLGPGRPVVTIDPGVARRRGATGVNARMAAVVQLHEDTTAFLVVTGKLSDIGRFGRDDLSFLQLMSRQLEVAIAPRVQPPVDQLHLLELELNHRVRRDPLTGLANELGLIERLRHEMGASAAATHAVVAISFGVADGAVAADTEDFALVVSQRLTGSLRHRDTLARWSPDVFVATVALSDDADEVRSVARRLLDRLSTAVSVSGDEHQLDLRIGICRSDAADDPVAVVDKAVAACVGASPLHPVVIVTS